MGSLSDNGGGWPPDGGRPDGLPDLPPEWGDIVVPDDLSSLSAEVAAVRAELHREQDRTAWQRFARRIGVRHVRRPGAVGFRGPALIIAMAVLVTLASLWASAWPGPARPPSSRSANGTDTRTLPALELIDTDGQHVPLNAQLPAVILLIDGCDCSQLIADTAALVRQEIAVITVLSGTTASGTVETAGPVARTAGVAQAAGAAQTAGVGVAPAEALRTGAVPQTGAAPPAGALPPAPGAHAVLALRDPVGELRSAFDLAAPDGNAAALLVSRTGQIVRTVRRTASVEDIRPDLERL
jgi:hypothetical protein